MSQIAIDIVLLPPEDIMDQAIAINKQLLDDPIILDKENCLPHISLCMGVIAEKQLSQLKEIIDQISKQYKAFPLTINKNNGRRSCFEIQNDKELQRLHESIMHATQSYLSYDATTDMCFPNPPVIEKTVSWINGYKDNTSFQNFYPHITLGTTKYESQKLNINFLASRLAICHLGNYCTCRKILHVIDLG